MTREPEWDDVSAAEMEALHLLRAGQCAGCGSDLAETAGPEHTDHMRFAGGFAAAVTNLQCRVCGAVQSRQRDYHQARQKAQKDGPRPNVVDEADGRVFYGRVYDDPHLKHLGPEA